ncbi:MAG: hypothetical protein KKD07_00960 [Candidatus Omnitrophica bacterium]|nr:hypothetical protein [Candidatus Omnitrophota bacterium]MBU1997458.1 hypothetical protein [Candidatus Omnitrophota bacterium]MBU4332992.1 hypothetical protein [Candidatus Omnitrophota bacterium]
MKRSVFIILLCLLSTSFCEAAPAYGTKQPEKKQFFIGAQTYSILERKLEQEHGEVNSLQHFVNISYGIFDWLSLDLKGGAGNIKQKPDIGNEIVYPSFMSGGYGFRMNLYDNNKIKYVFGFQHISVHPYSQKINETKHKSVLDDWQLSFLGSIKFSKITPYLGFRWSRADYIHWVNDERNRKKSDLTRSMGIIAGSDIKINERTWINIEGQFVDSKAFSIGMNFSF